MLFDFRDLGKKVSDLVIKIDNFVYSNLINYTKVNELSIENNDCKVKITGYLDLQNIPIQGIVKISPKQITFNKSFIEKNTNKLDFNKQILEITFFKLSPGIVLNENFISYCKKIKAEIKRGDYITLKLKEIRDIDLNTFQIDPIKQENLQLNRIASKGWEIDLSQEISRNSPSLRGRDLNDSSFDLKKFALKEEGNETQFINNLSICNDYLDFKQEMKFMFPNPFFKIKTKLLRKQNIPQFRSTFSSNKFSHLIISYNNKKDKLNIYSITTMRDLLIPNAKKHKQNLALDFYKTNVFINYIWNTYIRLNKVKEPIKAEFEFISNVNKGMEELRLEETPIKTNKESKTSINTISNVNECIDVINGYINYLQAKRKDISNLEITNGEILSILDNRIKSEIFCLRIFIILFLNLKNKEKNIIEDKLRLKTFKNWLNEYTEDEFSRKFNELSKKIPQDIFELILLCVTYGRIIKAIDLATKNGYQDLSLLLSQTNSSTSFTQDVLSSIQTWKNNGIYPAFPENYKRILDIISNSKIKQEIDFNWKQRIFCQILYSKQRITLIDNEIREEKCLAYYIIINYLSLGNDKNIMKKLVSNQTPAHLSFILIDNLITNYNDIFYKPDKENLIILRKLYFNLLLQCIEDMLLYPQLLKYSLLLINNSFLNVDCKKRMIEDLLHRAPEEESQNIKLEFIDELNLNRGIGIQSYSKFNNEKAINYFIKSLDYVKVSEVIFFFMFRF
jgi:hypothetical protein